MRIHFDPDFDAGAWPGPLRGAGPAPRAAVVGEAWVGPLGLLNLLETEYGLRGPASREAERVGQVARAAQRLPGFWTASAGVDPLAVARRLLQWRDLLVQHGWSGRADTALPPRIAALAEVTAGAPPGLTDRFAAVLSVALTRASGVGDLVSFEPRDRLTPLMRALFDALEARGTRIAYAKPAAPERSGAGDLARAGVAGQVLTGDGSLQLLRPHGVLEAADAVAAALAACDSLDGTVVIGPDAVLDAALHRHGVPTTGAGGHTRDNAVLEVLPLVLKLAFSPPDPQRALELLTLPQSPIPRGIAGRLARALHHTPAVDGDAWREALARGLEKLEETDGEERREAVKARLGVLFSRPSPGGEASGRVRIDDLRARSRCVGEWLRSRLALAQDDDAAGIDRDVFGAAVAQHAAFETYLDLSGEATLGEAQVNRLLDEATREGRGPAPFDGQAGLVSVGGPGALAGPARRIVWWSFDLRSASRVAPWPFAPAELEALASVGVQLPARDALAVAQAHRWRRPLEAAAEALVLVCPERGEDGDARHPHPLLDELLTAVPAASRPRAQAAITRSSVALPVPPAAVARELRATVRPQHTWQVPSDAVSLRPVESPSSAEKLLGCSLAWVLDYVGKLRGGMTAQLPEGERLLGNFAHALLEQVLHELPDASPDEAAARAAELFASEGPRLAAALFRPGQDKAREDARTATRAATGALYQLLRDGRFSVAAIEKKVKKSALGSELEGQPDLMLQDAQGEPVVVDLKWGKGKRYQQLKGGTATQLAAYGALHHEPGRRFPPGAFFIVRAQQVLTSDPGVFPAATEVNGPRLEDTWRALQAAHADAHARLAKGAATAPGLTPDGNQVDDKKLDRDAGLDDESGPLTLGPPCRYCDLATLCGRTFAPAPINEDTLR